MTTANASAATGERPNLAEPQAKRRTIFDHLQDTSMRARFGAVLPRHISAERMVRVCTLAVAKTPKLAECDLMSLVGAMMVCASLGLEPNTPLGLAYLIPFNKRVKNQDTGRWEDGLPEVQLIVGYRGFIDLARRSGGLVSLHADVVYEGDEFDFHYGTDMKLRHRPIGMREGRKPLWAYSYASLTDGQAFEVLPYAQVLKIRDNSQGYRSALANKDKEWGRRAFESSPWVAYEHEMSSKTMIRRLAKLLPLSIEFANAAKLDAMSETGEADMRAFAAASAADAFADVSFAERRSIEHSGEEPMGGMQTGQDNREPVAREEGAGEGKGGKRGGKAKAAEKEAGKGAPAPEPAAAAAQPGKQQSEPATREAAKPKGTTDDIFGAGS